jgi:heme-degrading monooxygenase HmoA
VFGEGLSIGRFGDREDRMHAVIFEVEPAPGQLDTYLEIAARLRPELEKIDGFISIERFRSLSREGKILSLSFWRDEEAIRRWREQRQHHEAQLAGRDRVFADYRLRVAAVLRDYGMHERAQAPQEMPEKAPPGR